MIEKKAARIKLLILDADGVMTDGRIIINDQGEEFKSFDSKDGLGLKMLIKNGIDVAIISGRKSKAVEYRAKELGVREVHQGIEEKGTICKELIHRRKLKRDQVCCMGDDLLDISMFYQAGISIAVADAVAEARNAANFITKNRGGSGAIREVCELILKAQKKWPALLSGFIGEKK